MGQSATSISCNQLVRSTSHAESFLHTGLLSGQVDTRISLEGQQAVVCIRGMTDLSVLHEQCESERNCLVNV